MAIEGAGNVSSESFMRAVGGYQGGRCRLPFGLPPPGLVEDCPLCGLPPSLWRAVLPRARTAACKSADHGVLSRTWSSQRALKKRPDQNLDIAYGALACYNVV